MAFKRVSHVLFDMDGLLLDTEILYTIAINNILRQYGKEMFWEQKRQMMGFTGPDSAKFVVKCFDLPITWEEYSKKVQVEYEKVFPTAKLMPDTEKAYKQIMHDIAHKFGKVYTPKIQQKILGRTEPDTAKIAIQEMDLPYTLDEFLADYTKRCQLGLRNAALLPGAEKLVRHLHKNKVPIALATSSSMESVEIKIQNHKELFSLFHHKVSGTSDPEVKNGKPSPDIFLVCASRFPDKPNPEKCLVFEDAPNGVKAATSAGMQSVMVPDPHIPEELTKQATVVLKSLEEFKPELFGLPAFE